MKVIARIGATLAWLAAVALHAEVVIAGQTQIVLQWLDTAQDSIGSLQLFSMEDALKNASSGAFLVDGHDRGSGTTNVFLLAEDAKVNMAITTAIRVFEQGKLPPGMRIGRAIYADEQRRDWHYQPVYPPGLRDFQIMYNGPK